MQGADRTAVHLQSKRRAVLRTICQASVPLLPYFDKTLASHLPESHVRLPPWRFFSHIPRPLSFGAAPKAAFGDAIRKAGGPSAFALATKREERRRASPSNGLRKRRRFDERGPSSVANETASLR